MKCILVVLGLLVMLILPSDALRFPALTSNQRVFRTFAHHCKLTLQCSSMSEAAPKQTKSIRSSIPNALTISRIYSIPAFLVSFLTDHQGTALGIYVASCVTDLLDGYLARKWNQMSDFGAFLDPVADKLMVATALILLTSRFPSLLYVLPVTLIMMRELGVSALREWMAGRGRRSTVEVGKLGKLKTVFQMVSTSLLLMVVPDNLQKFDICVKLGISKPTVFATGIAALYVSAVLTLMSGLQYLQAAWPTLVPTADDKSAINVK